MVMQYTNLCFSKKQNNNVKNNINQKTNKQFILNHCTKFVQRRAVYHIVPMYDDYR